MKRELSALCLILSLGGLARAGDAKLDPTGTWKQIQPASSTQAPTFTFKLQGETLTGSILRRNGSIAITNGVAKGSQVSFQIRHEASRPKGVFVTTTFTGTLNGDTIAGKMAVKTDTTDFASTTWQIRRETNKSNHASATHR